MWLLREIRSFGYEVGYSILCDFLLSICPAAQLRFEKRFETAPGRQAQVDFAMFKIEFNDAPQQHLGAVENPHYL